MESPFPISDTQYGGKLPYSCPCYLFVKLTLKIYVNNLGQAFYLAKQMKTSKVCPKNNLNTNTYKD